MAGANYVSIYANSPGLSGSLPDTEVISRSRVPKTTILKEVWISCPEKTKIYAPYVPKFRNHLASYACITVSGFIFLHDACCSLQTNRREFLLCYPYISESLIGWVFNHLKSLIDRSTFFPRNCLGGERGGEWYWHTRSGEGGGVLVRKKISRFEIARGWHLCDLIILQTNPVIKDYYFILNVSKCKCINSKTRSV